MVKAEAQIFTEWMKNRVEPSDWVVTETIKLYDDYAAYFKSQRPKEYQTVQPMKAFEWGVYMTNFFGKATRKRINGKIRWVRSLVIKKEVPS